MRRMISVLTIVPLMVEMLAVMAMPAFATEGSCNGDTTNTGGLIGNANLLGSQQQGNCNADNDTGVLTDVL